MNAAGASPITDEVHQAMMHILQEEREPGGGNRSLTDEFAIKET